tara:strand:- start:2198 stop:2440 length:243 start_codon:yes stop_codon:yes gene_type:complete
MLDIIQSIILSIIIIVIGHFIYFSLSDILFCSDETVEPQVVDLKKQQEEREKIMSSLREEEDEDEDLEQYLKSKLNVLNT